MLYAEDQAAQHRVLASRKQRVEPGPDPEDRRQPPFDLDLSHRRLQNARDYAQKRALSGTVAAHDAEGGARLYVQVHVLQRPEVVAALDFAETKDLAQPRGAVRGDPVPLGDAS